MMKLWYLLLGGCLTLSVVNTLNVVKLAEDVDELEVTIQMITAQVEYLSNEKERNRGHK